MLLPHAYWVQSSIQVLMTWDILVDLALICKYDGISHQLYLPRLRLWRLDHPDSALTAIHQSTVMAPDEERAVLTTHTDDQERNLLLTHLNDNPTCKMKTSQPLTEPNQDQFPSLCTEFTTAQTHQSLHHCHSAHSPTPLSSV